MSGPVIFVVWIKCPNGHRIISLTTVCPNEDDGGRFLIETRRAYHKGLGLGLTPGKCGQCGALPPSFVLTLEKSPHATVEATRAAGVAAVFADAVAAESKSERERMARAMAAAARN